MNYKMMGRFTAQMLLIEGIFLIPALLISLFLGESAAAYGFAVTLGLIALVGGPMYFFCRDAKSAFYATDGMVCVAVSWLVLSLVGAIPFHPAGGGAYGEGTDVLAQLHPLGGRHGRAGVSAGHCPLQGQ